MNFRKILSCVTAGAVTAALALTAQAAMVQKFDLGGLVGNADKIFRGTVVSKEPGTVEAGGSTFPTVIYTLRVDQAIKGDFASDRGKSFVTLQMIGDLKARSTDGRHQRLSGIDMNPDLDVGGDYVLFATRPSSVGLSTTVGLDQGLFRVFANAQGREMTANGLDNNGLFDGAIEYQQLVNAIKAEIQ
jgi:hypothetical protein